MEKVKKIAKYATNILGVIGALITGINGVEGITIPYAIQVVGVISVIQGVIGTYLLGNKVVKEGGINTMKKITKEMEKELSNNKGDDSNEQ